MQIIKDGRIVEDAWRHLDDEDPIVEGPISVSLERWRRERDGLRNRAGPVGVRLRAGDPAEALADDLEHLAAVVLDFASLRDGRSFSQARILREHHGYAGEIRARGDFIRDQMFFLSRVGVNVFELADGHTPGGALQSLNDFSVVYQPAPGDPGRAASAIGQAARPRY